MVQKVVFRINVYGRPVQPIVMIFGAARGLADVIHRAKNFISIGLRVTDIIRVNFGSPIGSRKVLTSLLHYCAHT